MYAGYFPPVSIWNWSLEIDGTLHKKAGHKRETICLQIK
jgi:hypothetical protein